jgi:hypothetical protein
MLAVLTALSGCALSPARQAFGTTVTVDGSQIRIHGKSQTLFGFRVGSAALREDWTRELIGELDHWQRHGVNAFTLWLQGTSGAYHPVFTADGRAISDDITEVIARTGYGLKESSSVVARDSGKQIIARTRRIVEAADARGMVVIIGIAYRSAWPATATPEVVARAMQAAAMPFRDYSNVIFNVWNEINTGNTLEVPANIAHYVSAVRAAAPRRLVCAGSLQSKMNLELVDTVPVDLWCQDAGRNLKDTLAAFDALVKTGKPIVNVESFGGNGGGYVDYRGTPPTVTAGYFVDFAAHGGWRRVYGVWEEEDYADATERRLMGKHAYRALIRHVGADATKQRHLLVHVAGWFQGASRVESGNQLGPAGAAHKWNNRFDRGHEDAGGTLRAPGIGWLLREMGAQR